jgi:hypothetical protein
MKNNTIVALVRQDHHAVPKHEEYLDQSMALANEQNDISKNDVMLNCRLRQHPPFTVRQQNADRDHYKPWRTALEMILPRACSMRHRRGLAVKIQVGADSRRCC